MRLFKKLVTILILLLGLNSFSQEKIDLLILNKKYQQALNEIGNRINRSPSADLYMKQGMVYNLQQQYQKAAESFFNANTINSENVNILEELAEVLTKLDNHNDAVLFFQQANRIAPENLTIAAKLGATYINLKDYENALRVFTDIYEKDSSNVFWNKQYAFCVAKTRANDSLAVQLYEGLLKKNPRDLTVYTSLHTLYLRQKEQGLAEVALLKGLAEFPENPELLQKIGNFYFANKKYENASLAYKSLLENSIPEYEILKNYGICLYFNKTEKEAIEVLDQCMAMTFNDPIVLFYLSLCNKKLADFELAEDFMQAAIEAATPSYLPEMYHHLGQIYGMQRKFEESIAALKESYEQDPTNFEILFEIATTYEEFNFNKTLALNYYRSYLIEGGEAAKNINYALTRIERIKEDLFFEE
ncbi:MAG: hypothetical protein JXR31_02855 [Prolixibacteraceae bacterium]|nr:hypothetical protein [Prolixibacteraceae bacterium]MBN2773162.1 hypothetical protein [Prolixibacteraceae bacterium]